MSSISVVLPVYNRQNLIEETLRSIEQQRLPPNEVIVVNDGSTDGVVGVVKQFARSSMLTIRCIDNYREKGVSGALNCGIEAARGELIAQLDSDDAWTPVHLEQLAGALAGHPEAAIAFSNAEFFGEAVSVSEKTAAFAQSVRQCLAFAFNEQEDGTWVSSHRLLEALLSWGVPFRCRASLIRRALINRHRLYFDEDISYTEDAQFLTMAAWYTPFVYVAATGLRIRRYAENGEGARYGEKVFQSYDTRVMKLVRFFEEKKLSVAERKALNKRLAELQSWAMVLRSRDRSIIWKVGECLTLMKRVPGFYGLKTIARTVYRQWLTGRE